MKALFYVLVAATCIVVIGFIGNQVYRQREADRAAVAIAEQSRANLAAGKRRLACENVVERARSFSTGSVEDLNRIEAELADCGLTLSNVQR